METHTPSSQPITIPVAIIVAGALIAGAVLWTQRGASVRVNDGSNIPQAGSGEIAPISANDHIFGSPQAKIFLVEYSDTSCPFCKTYHGTMKRISEEYAKSGDVDWVYRHFPLENIHPNARNEAHALECAAEIGSSDVFWNYTNKLYEVTPAVTQNSPRGLDQNELPKIAATVGLNVTKFNECMASQKHTGKIQADLEDGSNAGVMGTPFTFIVTKSGKVVPINGAQPYSAVKAAIDTLLLTEK
jgi:protein-disulfide isomerase